MKITNNYGKEKKLRVIKGHPLWSQLDEMELGEEIQDDVWNVVKIPGGFIVKRLNWGAVFVPENK